MQTHTLLHSIMYYIILLFFILLHFLSSTITCLVCEHGLDFYCGGTTLNDATIISKHRGGIVMALEL